MNSTYSYQTTRDKNWNKENLISKTKDYKRKEKLWLKENIKSDGQNVSKMSGKIINVNMVK